MRVVTKDSAFRPEGLDEVRVAPGSVTRVPLTDILGTAIEDGAVGLHVEASHPVTATLRSFVAGDLSHTVPLPVLTGQTQTILPDGRATVVLAGEGVGTAEVLARLDGGGKKVVTVELAPGRDAPRCDCRRGPCSCRSPRAARPCAARSSSRTAVRRYWGSATW